MSNRKISNLLALAAFVPLIHFTIGFVWMWVLYWDYTYFGVYWELVTIPMILCCFILPLIALVLMLKRSFSVAEKARFFLAILIPILTFLIFMLDVFGWMGEG